MEGRGRSGRGGPGRDWGEQRAPVRGVPLGLTASGDWLEVGSGLERKDGDSGLSPGSWLGGWWLLLAEAWNTGKKGGGD